jgi:hypothetical protein
VEPTNIGPALTVRQLLTPSEQAAKEQLNSHLDAAVKLKVGISREQVIEAILGLFDIPLTDILFPAWEQYREVREAMARTREEPGTVCQVRVGGHTLTSKHRPTLECDLDNVNVFTLKLELDLSVHFAGVVVTITRGEIKSLGPGDATVTASLKTDKGVTLIPDQQLIVVFSQPLTKPQPPAEAASPLAVPSRGQDVSFGS